MSTTDDRNPDDPQNPANPHEADDVILSEETAVFGEAQFTPAPDRSIHDLAAAYVLDALSEEEREAYEAHLVDCVDCGPRIAELQRVANLLPNALIVPPSELPDAYPFLLRDVAHETLPISSTLPGALADQPVIVEEASEEPIAAPAEPVDGDESTAFTPFIDAGDEKPDDLPIVPEVEESIAAAEPDAIEESTDPLDEPDDEPLEVAPARPARQPRPPGRIRPGVRPPGGPAATVVNQRVAIRATPTVIAFSLLGLVAVGLFLWALLLQGRINDLEGDIDNQNAELAQLRQNANATSYTLVPTAGGPQGATGTFFFSLPDQRGALIVRGLSAPPSGQTYQIWYIDNDGSDPLAGPPFQVNGQGEAAVPLSLNATTFDAIAISLEPAPESDEPTTDYLLQGELGGAAG